MSANMQLAMTLLLRGQDAVSAGLNKTRKAVSGLGGVAQGVTGELKRMYEAANGFSTTSKLAGLVGGTALLRDTEDAVLAFQRMQLELKQTAGLTKDQVSQISDYAKESAAAMLSTPAAMMEGAVNLANAGMKWENLLPVLKQAAKDAAAFRASVGEMANMDYDISTKMHIDSADLSAAHNMLLYHARSGRFEAPAMSRGAPELFTYANKVGLEGTQGLNLIGAMTQAVMKGVAPDQQTKVLTDFEQGFSHIVTPHYMKGLNKVGIDVEKYMPNGKFYGEGGVQGFTDLVTAMKKAGLENPFKMAKAGFADKETKDFWYQMMRGSDGFAQAMREAEAAAKSGQTDKDRAEITGSAVGQDAQAKAKWQAKQLDATGGVSVYEQVKNKAAESPIATALSAVVLGLGARALWKGRQARAEMKTVAAQASALHNQHVFVTNWPKSLGVAGTLQKPELPSGSGVPGPKESKSAKVGRLATFGLAAASELAAAGYVGWQFGSMINDRLSAETGNKIGEMTAKVAAFFGNKEAQQALNINLHIDGKQVATVVNAQNTTQARRH
jgi:hypothetical protein